MNSTLNSQGVAVSSAQEKEHKRWNAMLEGSDDAVAWIQKVRHDVDSVASKADELSLNIYRSAYLAKKIGASALRPMTVGVFGVSQAGKSYLISALAADDTGTLVTRYEGQERDFVKDINPHGSGSEATALVTRFTQHAQTAPAGYPVELHLLSEIDVAKILVNSYEEDLRDQSKATIVTQNALIKALEEAEGKKQTAAVAGVSAGDAVAFLDYISGANTPGLTSAEGGAAQHSGGAVRGLADDMRNDHPLWLRFINVLPHLSLEDRADLLQLFWGRIPTLKQLYIDLAKVLQQLHNVRVVFTPEYLICTVNEQGVVDKRNSMLSVSSLKQIDNAETVESVEVMACLEGEQDKLVPVSVNRAYLGALVAEYVFPLVRTPKEKTLHGVDLLDFPGYRGRLGSSGQGKAIEENGLAEIFLRGKVEYLFRNYAENQEVNALIVCALSTKQLDVDIVEVIAKWVHNTQGDQRERARRSPGLIWALTMFDMRVNTALSNPSDDEWDQMVERSLIERFKYSDWFKNWEPGKKFNNVFLVRKPGVQEARFIEFGSGGNAVEEVAFTADAKERLPALRTVFLNSENVQEHIKNPERAWDTALTLNDGGMSYLAEYISGIANIDYKLERLKQVYEHQYHQVITEGLSPFYRKDQNEERAEKRKRLIAIKDFLLKPAYRHDVERFFSDFLLGLQLPESELELGGEARPASGLGGLGFRTQLDNSVENAAKNTMKTWRAYLRGLTVNELFANWLANSNDPATLNGELAVFLKNVVEEIIAAARVVDLEFIITQTLQKTTAFNTVNRDAAPLRKRITLEVLNRFTSYFFLKGREVTVPDFGIQLDENEKLFAMHSEFDDSGLPVLATSAPTLGLNYVKSWLLALAAVSLSLGKSQEFSIEDNEWLGKIITTIEAHKG